MLILGNKYKLLESEIEFLKKRFSNIYYIRYKNRDTKEVIKKIQNIIDAKHDTLVVLNTRYKLPKKLIDYLVKLDRKGIKYITIEELLETYFEKCLVNSDNDIVIDTIKTHIHSYSKRDYIIKRVIDYIGVALLFIPTIFIMLYSKYKILKESSGPLLYIQERVGKDEKVFKCVKIRSMHEYSEFLEAKFATENDPRCYKWGKRLRDTKLDELTQIWNIIKGEMHLVGPRPERPIWVKEFKKSIPLYTLRHTVAPGITGLAQIEYHYGRNKIDAEQKLMYDLYYIKNWSLKLELKIIFKTIKFIICKIATK